MGRKLNSISRYFMKKIVISLLQKIFNLFPARLKIFVSRLLIKNIENIFIFDTETISKLSNNLFSKIYNESSKDSGDAKFDTIYKRIKLITAYEQLSLLLDTNIEGDIAECGCWNGNSTIGFSKIINLTKTKDKTFYVFDSFEGLSDFSTEDKTKKVTLKEEEKLKKHFSADFEKVKERLLPYKFVNIFKGWIPDIFQEANIQDNKFAFVHIDVDLFEPTYESVKYFFPKLSPGGVLICDDYGSEIFPGATLAIDQFLNSIDDKEILSKTSGPAGGIIIIKK